MLAPEVRNEGIISARLGTVALGSGEQITLDFTGDRLVNLAVDRSALHALVVNRHLIQTDGGTVILAAKAEGDLAATVVNNEGIIRAQSVTNNNGAIRLAGGNDGIVSVSGTLDVSGRNTGETGGAIQVLGNKVGLMSAAAITASGDAGGGTILIGGDYQGKSPGIPNAQATYVASTATINADAINSGNGGKVIVWTDDTTRYYGNITARCGTQAGDGGFVEVSGKQHSTFRGMVDTLAPYGKGGMLLLDPADIIIANGINDSATDGDTTFSGNPSGSVGTVFSVDDSPSTIYESELEGIARGTNISLTASNSITIDNLADGNLNLAQTAGNSVTFNSGADGFSMADVNTRKVTKSRGSFPNDDALIKLYYLALRNISKK